jgi:signal transduction histidine kinase
VRIPFPRSPAPFPVARLGRIALVACTLAVVVYAGGTAWTRVVFGGESSVALRVTGERIKEDLEVLLRALKDATEPLAESKATLIAAEADVHASRALFDIAQASSVSIAAGLPRRLSREQPSLTMYGARGTPVAWNGQPSDLPAVRLVGDETWFFTRGSLGPRLVYVRPITDGSGRRIGVVAGERALTSANNSGRGPGAVVRLPESVAPVWLYPPDIEAPVLPVDGLLDIQDPLGRHVITGVVRHDDVAAEVRRAKRRTMSLVFAVLGLGFLLLVVPLLDWRDGAAGAGRYAGALVLIAASLAGGRLLLRVASPADWNAGPLFSAAVYASAAPLSLLSSPFDFLATVVVLGTLVALGLRAVEAWRLLVARHGGLRTGRTAVLAGHLATGVLLAFWLAGYQAFLAGTLASTTLDLLHFSLHPWDSARVALQLGLVVSHAAALGFGVLLLRLARVPRPRWAFRGVMRAGAVLCWVAPSVGWALWTGRVDVEPSLTMPAGVVVVVAATVAASLWTRYRRGSQGFRLVGLGLVLVLSALAAYPTVFRLAQRAKARQVETRFAPQVINQRESIKVLIRESLDQIDALLELPALVSSIEASDAGPPDSDRAFAVWNATALATPVTSSIELYGPDGALASRFAFNLPEDLSGVRRRQESACAWDVYEEVSPFFAEERRILHAGRATCDSEGGSAGSIVVHAMLGYEDLPFISSQSPYVSLIRRDAPMRREGVSGRDVELAVYGWSRTPLFASRETAWAMEDGLFSRAVDSREPFWARLSRGDEDFECFVVNDRGGIYVLGYPVVSPLGHLVNLAELTVLGGVAYALWLLASVPLAALGRRASTARALLREIRASFYRKLFLAVVAAAVVPVAALALVTRTYVARQIRSAIESEAVRTVSAARRVVEDLAAPRADEPGYGVDDDLMVWVSRLIGEDANIFAGARLIATSERNLFASGVLSTRTPASVYSDLTLSLQASTVTREPIGDADEYLVVGTPITAAGIHAMLTIPLTLRQQEVDSEIDTLDRRVLLAFLLFVLAGAGIGYSIAERIADPVKRLTRATRRIASGDLDARIVTTSSDELRRLVDAFNSMAADLQRQRGALERTHRLEAWAEMARQVAHEIKNPLTPIQLNAEHLLRVHADHGEPMGPVLKTCIDTILGQVALLRRIASEFSSFASEPSVRCAPVSLNAAVDAIVGPYRVGLDHRIQFSIDVPRDLPPALVDGALLGRALANLVENALHAMPGPGMLTVGARVTSDTRGVGSDVSTGALCLTVSDTGGGMDAKAIARAFEPYFSTKAAGTGLGLPIVKRNVELCGGSVAITSAPNEGTTVEVTLPIASATG